MISIVRSPLSPLDLGMKLFERNDPGLASILLEDPINQPSLELAVISAVPAVPQVVAAADASIALAFKNRKFFEIWHVLILGFERSFISDQIVLHWPFLPGDWLRAKTHVGEPVVDLNSTVRTRAST